MRSPPMSPQSPRSTQRCHPIAHRCSHLFTPIHPLFTTPSGVRVGREGTRRVQGGCKAGILLAPSLHRPTARVRARYTNILLLLGFASFTRLRLGPRLRLGYSASPRRRCKEGARRVQRGCKEGARRVQDISTLVIKRTGARGCKACQGARRGQGAGRVQGGCKGRGVQRGRRVQGGQGQGARRLQEGCKARVQGGW